MIGLGLTAIAIGGKVTINKGESPFILASSFAITVAGLSSTLSGLEGLAKFLCYIMLYHPTLSGLKGLKNQFCDEKTEQKDNNKDDQ